MAREAGKHEDDLSPYTSSSSEDEVWGRGDYSLYNVNKPWHNPRPYQRTDATSVEQTPADDRGADLPQTPSQPPGGEGTLDTSQPSASQGNQAGMAERLEDIQTDDTDTLQMTLQVETAPSPGEAEDPDSVIQSSLPSFSDRRTMFEQQSSTLLRQKEKKPAQQRPLSYPAVSMEPQQQTVPSETGRGPPPAVPKKPAIRSRSEEPGRPVSVLGLTSKQNQPEIPSKPEAALYDLPSQLVQPEIPDKAQAAPSGQRLELVQPENPELEAAPFGPSSNQVSNILQTASQSSGGEDAVFTCQTSVSQGYQAGRSDGQDVPTDDTDTLQTQVQSVPSRTTQDSFVVLKNGTFSSISSSVTGPETEDLFSMGGRDSLPQHSTLSDEPASVFGLDSVAVEEIARPDEATEPADTTLEGKTQSQNDSQITDPGGYAEDDTYTLQTQVESVLSPEDTEDMDDAVVQSSLPSFSGRRTMFEQQSSTLPRQKKKKPVQQRPLSYPAVSMEPEQRTISSETVRGSSPSELVQLEIPDKPEAAQPSLPLKPVEPEIPDKPEAALPSLSLQQVQPEIPDKPEAARPSLPLKPVQPEIPNKPGTALSEEPSETDIPEISDNFGMPVGSDVTLPDLSLIRHEIADIGPESDVIGNTCISIPQESMADSFVHLSEDEYYDTEEESGADSLLSDTGTERKGDQTLELQPVPQLPDIVIDQQGETVEMQGEWLQSSQLDCLSKEDQDSDDESFMTPTQSIDGDEDYRNRYIDSDDELVTSLTGLENKTEPQTFNESRTIQDSFVVLKNGTFSSISSSTVTGPETEHLCSMGGRDSLLQYSTLSDEPASVFGLDNVAVEETARPDDATEPADTTLEGKTQSQNDSQITDQGGYAEDDKSGKPDSELPSVKDRKGFFERQFAGKDMPPVIAARQPKQKEAGPSEKRYKGATAVEGDEMIQMTIVHKEDPLQVPTSQSQAREISEASSHSTSWQNTSAFGTMESELESEAATRPQSDNDGPRSVIIEPNTEDLTYSRDHPTSVASTQLSKADANVQSDVVALTQSRTPPKIPPKSEEILASMSVMSVTDDTSPPALPARRPMSLNPMEQSLNLSEPPPPLPQKSARSSLALVEDHTSLPHRTDSQAARQQQTLGTLEFPQKPIPPAPARREALTAGTQQSEMTPDFPERQLPSRPDKQADASVLQRTSELDSHQLDPNSVSGYNASPGSMGVPPKVSADSEPIHSGQRQPGTVPGQSQPFSAYMQPLGQAPDPSFLPYSMSGQMPMDGNYAQYGCHGYPPPNWQQQQQYYHQQYGYGWDGSGNAPYGGYNDPCYNYGYNNPSLTGYQGQQEAMPGEYGSYGMADQYYCGNPAQQEHYQQQRQQAEGNYGPRRQQEPSPARAPKNTGRTPPSHSPARNPDPSSHGHLKHSVSDTFSPPAGKGRAREAQVEKSPVPKSKSDPHIKSKTGDSKQKKGAKERDSEVDTPRRKPGSRNKERDDDIETPTRKPGSRKKAEAKHRRAKKDDEKVVEEAVEEEEEEVFSVFVRGLSPETKAADLVNVLEGLTGCDIDEDKVLVSEGRTEAMVVFRGKPDFKQLKDKLGRRRTCENWRVHALPPPVCVVISGDEDIEGSDTLVNFLEAKGGELASEDFQETEDGCKIAEFRNTDAVLMLSRKENLSVSGVPLTVTPYYRCNAGAIFDYNRHSVRIPGPVTVNRTTLLVSFLQRSCCETLTACLDESHTRASYSDNRVILTCTLTNRTKDCRKLARTWSDSAQDTLQKFISQKIRQTTLEIPAPVWKGMMDFIGSGELQMSDIALEEVEEKTLQVVGLVSAVDNLLPALEDQMKSLDRRVRRQEETKQFNKACKIHLLQTMGYFQELKDSYIDLELEVQENYTHVTLQGVEEDIQDAFYKIYEKYNQILDQDFRHGFSTELVQLLTTDKVRCYVSQKVKDCQDEPLEWEVTQQDIHVYVMEDNVNCAEDANRIITESVPEYTRNIVPQSLRLFETIEWTNLLQDITERYEHKFDIISPSDDSPTLLVVVATDDIHQMIVDEVEKFLSDHTILTSEIPCETVTKTYASKYWRANIQTLEENLSKQKVRINLDAIPVSVRVEGTAEGIKLAKEELKKLFLSIDCRKDKIEGCGIYAVVAAEIQKGTIRGIETQNRCLIQWPPDIEGTDIDALAARETLEWNMTEGASAYPESSRDFDMASDESTSLPMNFRARNGVSVCLVRGELGRQQGDVLVCSTSPHLNLETGAGASLLRGGGSQLQDDCRDNYPQGIKHGKVAVIGGGNLRCQQVYLTSLPNWSADGATKVLQDIMSKCLKKASGQSYRSIVFSAMGTGKLNYPKDSVADIMYQAIVDFDDKNPSTTLREVKFVLYQKDIETVQAFEDKERCLIQGVTTPSNVVQAGAIKVELVIDNLAQQRVDVVFCTTSPNMDMKKSGACNALLKAGGKSLQDECSSKYNNTLGEGQVGVIAGGNMPCRVVYLTVLPAFKSSQESEKLLVDVVTAALNLAQASGYTSMAMAALGTGFLKYPADVVAKCMYKAIDDFATAKPQSCVKSIRIILHCKDHGTIQAFRGYVHNKSRRNENPRKGRKLQPSTRRSMPMFSTGPSSMTDRKYNATANGCQVRSIDLKVYTGDILKEQTDGMVNSVTDDFKLLGAVADGLKAKCPKLEQECKTKESKLMSKGIAFTRAEGLGFKGIIHIPFQRRAQDWLNAFVKCLEKANKKGFKSLAFPVVGTGAGPTRFTPDQIAESLFDALDKFSERWSKPSLVDVRLVVFHKQGHMVSPIIRALTKKAQVAVTKQASLLGRITSGLRGFQAWTSGAQESESRQPRPDQPTEITLQVYSDSMDNIEACLKDLHQHLESEYTTKTLKDFKDIIKKMKDTQVKELEDMVYMVDITTDRQSGVITVKGPIRNVSEAADILQKKLREEERKVHQERTAAALFQQIGWYYEEITATGVDEIRYEKMPNFHIETAFKANKKTMEMPDTNANKVYVIDFVNLVEYPIDDPEDTVKVIRKDILKSLTGVALPKNWAKMGDKENIKMVPLAPTDPEYTTLEQTFIKGVKSGGYTSRIQFDLSKLQVSKIERIQNRMLYEQYSAKKKAMETQKPNLPSNMPIERSLWHGTTPDALASIQMHGFNRSYCGKHGTWYGYGVYFAPDPSYCARGWLSGAQGQQGQVQGPVKGYVFAVKVLTGQMTKGDKNMRFLPPVNPGNPSVLYDSAVDNLQNPQEYVIFHDTQAYPEYIITFTA